MQGMYENVRDLISKLGGYREVAARLDKGPTTVHSQMQAGRLPAAWYPAICQLAHEKKLPEPATSLFSFLALDGVAS